MFRANVIGDAFSAAASSKYHLSVKPWLMDKIYRATNLQLNLIAFMAPYDAQTMKPPWRTSGLPEAHRGGFFLFIY